MNCSPRIVTDPNKAAIGTKVKVKAMLNGTSVWQMRELSSQSSYCGQNDLRAHFGLGNATVIDSLKIEWLGGVVEIFDSLAINQFISITQGQGITGIGVSGNKPELKVFPNPSEGIVTLLFDSFEAGDVVYISNTVGIKIAEYRIESSTQQITFDLKNYYLTKGGIYFISLVSKSGSITKKIISN